MKKKFTVAWVCPDKRAICMGFPVKTLHDQCICSALTCAHAKKWWAGNLTWVLLIIGPITASEGWTRPILIPANKNK